MIAQHTKRALKDIAANRAVSALTVATIALAVLIVGAAAMFFLNTGGLLAAWQRGARIVAYLKPGIGAEAAAEAARAIEALEGGVRARYISSDEALADLRTELRHLAPLFDHLSENPLPASFEIEVRAAGDAWTRIEALAGRIARMPPVAEVEYGRKWIQSLGRATDLARRASVALTGLFLSAAAFIVANTVRLTAYARLEEVAIMRLVGATEAFIRAPFYIAALLQSLLGSLAGLAALFAAYRALAAEVAASGFAGVFEVHFLPPEGACAITLAGMLAGWTGCHLSLRNMPRA
jgi:cell division transport system permease protein